MYSKYDKTNHSVYKLTYHLVLVVKYRRKVITTPIFKSLINIFNKIGDKYGIEVIESNFEEDHIHILFKSTPNVNMQKFINSYKSASSRTIKKEYPQIYKVLWNGVFWKRGYFINTTGGANIETIKQYIERQQRRWYIENSE